MDEEKRQYQITFILSPNLEDKNADKISREFEQNINQLKGKIINKKKPEHKKLAYPIKKFETGYYLTISFLLNPEKIQELESQLKHNQDILRYMINYQEEVNADKKQLKKEKKASTSKGASKTSKKKEEKIKKGDIDKKIDEILGR